MKKPVALLLLALAALAALATYFAHVPDTVDVDNAFVTGHVISLAAPVAGIVEAIHLEQSATFPANRPAFLISDRDALDKVAFAETALRAAFLQAGRACLQLGGQAARVRMKELETRMADAKVTDARHLAAQGFVSQRFLDQQVLNEKTARINNEMEVIEQRRLETLTTGALPVSDQLVNAIEQLRLALIARQRASVRVDSAIFVQDISVLPGQWVDVGAQLATVIPVEAPRVQANILEAQIGRVFVGQAARVRIDGLAQGAAFTGHVEAIVPATAATFSHVQRNNVDSTWMKVAQRIPVLIRLDQPARAPLGLRIGQSAQVELLAQAQAPAPARAAPPRLAAPAPALPREAADGAAVALENDVAARTEQAKNAVRQRLPGAGACTLFGQARAPARRPAGSIDAS